MGATSTPLPPPPDTPPLATFAVDPDGIQRVRRRYLRFRKIFAVMTLVITAIFTLDVVLALLDRRSDATQAGFDRAFAIFVVAILASLVLSIVVYTSIAQYIAQIAERGADVMLYPDALVLRNLAHVPWTSVRKATVYRRKRFNGIILRLHEKHWEKAIALPAPAFGTTVEAMVEEFGRHLPLIDPRAPKPKPKPETPVTDEPASVAGSTAAAE